ncbi:LysR family transcriptional regulator [Pantoea sp. 18069]|uniref:LysR family transcriptional regulator n=1 Tax=Pantoea sp. 18069 TaxID=2681415 RepID=UPI001F173909|nr:LysR family transcriptional regulator [Pantoea sp. 18069]
MVKSAFAAGACLFGMELAGKIPVAALRTLHRHLGLFMDYRQIEAFRTVMLTRSMTNAASQLHTTQPNISRLIAKLQQELGLPLFKRVGLRLVPTPEAEALYREVQRSFIGLSAIQEAAASIRERGSGRILIGASVGLSVSVLPPALRLFRQKHRDVTVCIQTSDSRTVSRWAADGFCDFGLVAFVEEMPGLQTELLYREPGVCIVPAAHRLAERSHLQASDLDGEPFISFGPSTHERAAVDAAFVPDRRKLTDETPFALTIWTLVSMGLGVSVVSPQLQQALPVPNVRLVPFEPGVNFSCYAVRGENRVDQFLVSELMECVRQALREKN